MSEKLVNRIGKKVEKECVNNKKFPYRFFTNHIQKVYEHAIELAQQRGADKTIVGISAYLHDYAKIKGTGNEKHAEKGAKLSEEILNEMNVSKKIIESVKEIIKSHDINWNENDTPEAVCVKDADAISHFGMVDDFFYVFYERKKLEKEKGAWEVKNKMNKSWNKMSPNGRAIARVKYNNALKDIDENKDNYWQKYRTNN